MPLSTPGPRLDRAEPRTGGRPLGAALRDLTAQIDPARIAALAISNQRETVGFLDEAAPGLCARPSSGSTSAAAPDVGAGGRRAAAPSASARSPARCRTRRRRSIQPALAAAQRAGDIAPPPATSSTSRAISCWRLTGAGDELGQRRSRMASSICARLSSRPEILAGLGLGEDQFCSRVVRPARVLGE